MQTFTWSLVGYEVWSHTCPKLCTSPLQLPSSGRVVASQPPRCIRWKRKPGCLSGPCTAFQLILPSSGPPHTPTFRGTCWLQVLMLSGLPQSEAARVLLASPSRDMGSSSLHPDICFPSCAAATCCCHVSGSLRPPGVCTFGPYIFFDPLSFFYWDFGKKRNQSHAFIHLGAPTLSKDRVKWFSDPLIMLLSLFFFFFLPHCSVIYLVIALLDCKLPGSALVFNFIS